MFDKHVKWEQTFRKIKSSFHIVETMDTEYTANGVFATHCPSNGLVNCEINTRYLLNPGRASFLVKYQFLFGIIAVNIPEGIIFCETQFGQHHFGKWHCIKRGIERDINDLGKSLRNN